MKLSPGEAMFSSCFQQFIPVKHKRSTSIPIIGHVHSGTIATKITACLFRKYLGIGIGTERQFIIRYLKRLHRHDDFNEAGKLIFEVENLKLLINDHTKEGYFQRGKKFNNFVIDPDQIYGDIKEWSYSGVLNAAFMQFAKQLYRVWEDGEYILTFNRPSAYILLSPIISGTKSAHDHSKTVHSPTPTTAFFFT